MCGRSFLHWDTTGSFQQVSAGTGHSCSLFRLHDRRASSNFSGSIRRSRITGIVSFHSQPHGVTTSYLGHITSLRGAVGPVDLPHGGRDPLALIYGLHRAAACVELPRSCTGEADAYCVRIATVALCLSLDGSICARARRRLTHPGKRMEWEENGMGYDVPISFYPLLFLLSIY